MTTVRPLANADIPTIVAAFEKLGWSGKNAALYEHYLLEQVRSARVVHVAEEDGEFAGYVCVVWSSGYAPFRLARIPEIVDLNVLPHLRRRGVAAALMDAAEATIAERSPTAGLGVGLTADYSAAMSLYIGRGYRPDGRGVAYDGRTAPFGSTVRIDDSAALYLVRTL